MRALLIVALTAVGVIAVLGLTLRHVPEATAGPEAAISIDPYKMQSDVDMKKLPEQVGDDLI